MKHKDHRLKKGYKNLGNPLYLNANLVYSEALNTIKKPEWKRNIKAGTLNKLKEEGYQLVTSIFTRMEVIQRLCREENKKPSEARKIYHSIIGDNEIAEIVSIGDKVILTNDFIDSIACSNLDFKDAIHLTIAKKLDIPLCTHDKKLRGDFSTHGDKVKFYPKVYKPQELIKPKK